MTDDTDEELPEIVFEQPDSRSEVFDWSSPNGDGGLVMFPRGVEQFADDNDVQLVRIAHRTGLVEVLQEVGGSWRAVDKPQRNASVKAIKND